MGQGRFGAREGYAPPVRLAPGTLGQVQVGVPLAHGQTARGMASAFMLVLCCSQTSLPPAEARQKEAAKTTGQSAEAGTAS